MSYSTVLGVVPDRRPVELLELRNSHGWSASIWGRFMVAAGQERHAWWLEGFGLLEQMWQSIEDLDPWQQIPLVLTFDTGVVPDTHFEEAAEMLDEFDRRLPSPTDHVNHVPVVSQLLRSRPEVPLVGVWGTSVTDNPFDPWDVELDEPGSGIPIEEMYVLQRHRESVMRMVKR